MIALALLCALLVAALVYRERQHSLHLAAREKTWDLERGALLTRIQHPEFVVAAPEAPRIPDAELLTAEPDDIDLIGEVVTGNGNGD